MIICGGDFTCHPDTESDCADRDKHTPTPIGYVDRADWAVGMIARGASQRRCPTCGLYAIWSPPRRLAGRERLALVRRRAGLPNEGGTQ